MNTIMMIILSYYLIWGICIKGSFIPIVVLLNTVQLIIRKSLLLWEQPLPYMVCL